MTKTEIISSQIAAKIASGMSPVDALKAVLGVEKVEAMIDSLYSELRHRVA